MAASPDNSIETFRRIYGNHFNIRKRTGEIEIGQKPHKLVVIHPQREYRPALLQSETLEEGVPRLNFADILTDPSLSSPLIRTGRFRHTRTVFSLEEATLLYILGQNEIRWTFKNQPSEVQVRVRGKRGVRARDWSEIATYYFNPGIPIPTGAALKVNLLTRNYYEPRRPTLLDLTLTDDRTGYTPFDPPASLLGIRATLPVSQAGTIEFPAYTGDFVLAALDLRYDFRNPSTSRRSSILQLPILDFDIARVTDGSWEELIQNRPRYQG